MQSEPRSDGPRIAQSRCQWRHEIRRRRIEHASDDRAPWEYKRIAKEKKQQARSHGMPNDEAGGPQLVPETSFVAVRPPSSLASSYAAGFSIRFGSIRSLAAGLVVLRSPMPSSLQGIGACAHYSQLIGLVRTNCATHRSGACASSRATTVSSSGAKGERASERSRALTTRCTTSSQVRTNDATGRECAAATRHRRGRTCRALSVFRPPARMPTTACRTLLLADTERLRRPHSCGVQ